MLQPSFTPQINHTPNRELYLCVLTQHMHTNRHHPRSVLRLSSQHRSGASILLYYHIDRPYAALKPDMRAASGYKSGMNVHWSRRQMETVSLFDGWRVQ
jgi:hypothetical protein